MRIRIFYTYSAYTSPEKNSSFRSLLAINLLYYCFLCGTIDSCKSGKFRLWKKKKKRYTPGHKLCVSKGRYVQKIRGHIVTPIVALSSANNIQPLYNIDIAQRLIFHLLHNHKKLTSYPLIFFPFQRFTFSAAFQPTFTNGQAGTVCKLTQL
jgi:hypothetical protein